MGSTHRSSVKTISIGGKNYNVTGPEGDHYFEHLEEQLGSFEQFHNIAARFRSPGAVAIDVGANIGVTALVLAGLYDTVIAIEPGPKAFAALEDNVKANSASVDALNLAVGDKPGAVEFTPQFGSANHAVTPSHLSEAAVGGETISVKVETLDHIVERSDLDRLDFVKIDVEGFELNVLDGIGETLKRFKPTVMMEFNSFTTIAFRDVSPRVLLDRFLELFPYAYSIQAGALQPIRTAVEKYNFLHANLALHGCVDDILGSDASLL